MGILEQLQHLDERHRMVQCRRLDAHGVYAHIIRRSSSPADSKSLPERMPDCLSDDDGDWLYDTSGCSTGTMLQRHHAE